jgi:threonine dehydratase
MQRQYCDEVVLVEEGTIRQAMRAFLRRYSRLPSRILGAEVFLPHA